MSGIMEAALLDNSIILTPWTSLISLLKKSLESYIIMTGLPKKQEGQNSNEIGLRS